MIKTGPFKYESDNDPIPPSTHPVCDPTTEMDEIGVEGTPKSPFEVDCQAYDPGGDRYFHES